MKAVGSEHGRNGQLFVISAPSGTGKTTLCNLLVKKCARLNYSVSYTTREPRDNEVDGVNYHFVDGKTFEKMIDEDRFLEHAVVHGHFYGTGKDTVLNNISKGADILLDIDPQGAMKLKPCFPHAVYIFIVPPSLDILRKRLTGRKDSTGAIDLRMENAVTELTYIPRYDYLVVNDLLEDAYKLVESIYMAETAKVNLIKNINTYTGDLDAIVRH